MLSLVFDTLGSHGLLNIPTGRFPCNVQISFSVGPIHAQISQGHVVVVLLIKACHEIVGVVLSILDGACTLPDHNVFLLEVSSRPQLDLLAGTEDVHNALYISSVVNFWVDVSLGVLFLLLDALLLRFSHRWHERRDILLFEISIRLMLLLLLLIGANQAASKKLGSILSGCRLSHLSNTSFQKTVSCFIILRHTIVLSASNITVT